MAPMGETFQFDWSEDKLQWVLEIIATKPGIIQVFTEPRQRPMGKDNSIMIRNIIMTFGD